MRLVNEIIGKEIALSATPYALPSLTALVDPSHILFGSDYPFAPEPITGETVEGLNRYEGIDPRTCSAIESENALRILGSHVT